MQSRKLKVMQLGSPTGLYGAERWILALVRHLGPEKVTSIVASIKDDAGLEVPLCREASELGFQTKVFDSPGKVNFSAVAALCRYLKKEKVDILHTHGYKQDMIGLLAARMAGCRIISTPHGWSRDAGFKLRCYEGMNRMIFPFFDAVAPLSPDLCRPLSRIPGLNGKLHLIQNGVDTTEIAETSATAPLVEQMKAGGKMVIGYIGQLIQRKGVELLLEAMALMKGDDRYRLVVLGEGPLKGRLMQRAKMLGIDHAVTFTGFVENRLEFLKGFDAFVLPSRLEGIPRCLMEAMAAKIPVAASDIPGCRDLIRHGHSGLLFPPEDPRGIAEALEMIEHSPEEIRKMVQQGYDTVMSGFSAWRMAREYSTLFHSLAGDR